MWKSAYVVIYQLLNWKMHGETLKRNYEYSEFFGLASQSMRCHQSVLILLKKWGTDKPL